MNRNERKQREKERLEAIFNKDHSGTVAGRKLDRLLKDAELKKDDNVNDEDIELALLEAIWTMRWTENKESLYSVLSVEEAQKIVKDIFIELDKSGYKIIKK